MIELTQDLLKSLLDYDKETGVFTWKVAKPRVKVGQVAGYFNHGYIRVKIFQRNYEAHRLVWLYVHGRWPKELIDHINGDPSDNRLSNLREATQPENARNRRRNTSSASGFKGVRKHPRSKGWYATCRVDKKAHHLGTFETAEKAHAAYVSFAAKHHGAFHKPQ